MAEIIHQSTLKKVQNKLSDLTNHEIIELTDSGNTAIFAALYIARKQALAKDNQTILKKKVLIPDQGGWYTYKRYPQMLELEPVFLKTDNGIIDIKDLKNKLTPDVCCILYQNPAGYFAEQPIKEIYSLCKDKCLAILDISGSIGDKKLSNGKYADIIVCSFGKWKILELGYGGFFSLNNIDIYNKAVEILNLTDFDTAYLKELDTKLARISQKIQHLYGLHNKIVSQFSSFKILHKKYKGINIIIQFDTKEEQNKIISLCKKHNYPFVVCPRYIRVKKKAISIEVKRL